MNTMSDLFREEPIPFVIYNNDLRSKWALHILISYTHFYPDENRLDEIVRVTPILSLP